MPQAKIICIASQKGGTGKTTTTLNLGVCLAESGYQILLIDIDPQANLSMGVGFDIYKLKYTIYDVLLNPSQGLKLALIQTKITGLDLVPSTLDLAGAELELGGKIGREWLLKKGLVDLPEKYDFILIDTPPSLGLYTQNAFMASQEVLVPLQVHVYALRAIPQLQATINMVREYNPPLHIAGVVCTMYDVRNNLSKVVEETIRQQLADVVFRTVIPLSISLAESPASGQPITIYAPNSSATQAYRNLATEVIERAQKR
jgi:chromosome partitioning protein